MCMLNLKQENWSMNINNENGGAIPSTTTFLVLKKK